jgi:sporulation protein YlmC with PRC-barrel domain
MTRNRRDAAMPLSDLLDVRLHSRDGDLIGVVDELLIDLRTGRVEYLLATSADGRRLQFRWESVAIHNGGFVASAAPLN